MYSLIASFDLPLLAIHMAAAVAWAPLIPSGWSWVMDADMPATLSVSSNVSKNHPHAEALMALPLPQLPYGCLLPSSG